MLNVLISLVSLLVLLPASGAAYFDRIIQDDLQEALPALNDPLLEKRFAATQALLNFPQWSLPLIRQALQDSKFKAIHWRLAYLLSVLGTQTDILLLLKTSPKQDFGYQSKIWKGAAERLFWRYRKSKSQKYIISRLRFLPEQRQGNLITGKLLFRIVNPANEGRLIHPHFDFWHVQLPEPLPMPYYWIEANSNLEAEFPLAFTTRPQWKTLRIDMKVEEVGNLDGFITRYSYKVPFPPAKSSDDPLP